MLRDAAVVVENGLIAWVGRASEAPAADRAVDVEGCTSEKVKSVALTTSKPTADPTHDQIA